MNTALSELFGTDIGDHTAAAIGAFDGIHLGHRHILRSTVAYAEEHHLIPTAILFDPLPSQFFGKIGKDQRILLREEQDALLTGLGIRKIIVLPFSDSIADLSPEEFLEAMQSRIHCDKLFMGEDFSIGKGRVGTPEYLTALGSAFGFETEIIQKDSLDGDVISSTRIRNLLNSGSVREANRLLGYPFFFSSSVIHGAARGRRLGFPTLNVQIPPQKLKLPNGVYAVYAIIDGKKYASVTNIGVRPTFGLDDQGIVVESYLLNTGGDFYGKTAKLEFIEMLRKEIRFSGGDELRQQINRDIQQALHILC